MYRTHPTLAPEVTLPDVAPVEARALEATLVLSTLILLPVRGERLERSFARLALALRQTVRQGLMSYSNFRVDVHEEVDPITGMRKMT